jgi:hypothetical protein
VTSSPDWYWESFLVGTAKEDGVLVFVDVKVYTNSSKGFPSEVTTPEVARRFHLKTTQN